MVHENPLTLARTTDAALACRITRPDLSQGYKQIYPSEMDLSVKDYAAQAGISVPRVHELIRDRKIEARKIGSSWAIPESQLKRRAPLSRPLSLRNSWALIELLSGFQPVAIDATAAWRMRRKCVQIADEPDPVRLISSWR